MRKQYPQLSIYFIVYDTLEYNKPKTTSSMCGVSVSYQ